MSDLKPCWHIQAILLSVASISLALILWFIPFTHTWLSGVETCLFLRLNKTLLDFPSTQVFWGLLNHRREVWLNIILAIGINLWVILSAPKAIRLELFTKTLYFWGLFEFGLWIEDAIVNDYLSIKRLSPSLIVEPHVFLSEKLNNTMIIDKSSTSFPSGHAFALFYWGLFTAYISPKIIAYLALCIGIFLCLPRLVSGGHWISDTLFSLLMAMSLFSVAIGTPLYAYSIKLSEQISRLYKLRTKVC